ncbi:MAG: hypothetical protein K9M36_00940 [Candidatus Pacebacteria bacterium]|nr:hypothetical protein [Candidatus Paceibacterota bacterium]
MFENPFKKQTPKTAQENIPINKMETIQDFIGGKLESMQSLFGKLQSQFDSLGENVENLKFSPELASRAKIVLPVFMGLLTLMGNIEDASAQSQGQWVKVNGSWQFAGSTANTSGNTVQMTPEQWTAEQKRQKDLKTGQDLKTAGTYTQIAGGIATAIGIASKDPKVQNAALITGSALNLTGTVLTVVGNEKGRKASAGVTNQSTTHQNPHLNANKLPNGGRGY